jgi:hypothetical protein
VVHNQIMLLTTYDSRLTFGVVEEIEVQPQKMRYVQIRRDKLLVFANVIIFDFIILDNVLFFYAHRNTSIASKD